MRCRIQITGCALLAGLALLPLQSPLLAQSSEQSSEKVLAKGIAGFNVDALQVILDQGDLAVSKGNMSEARGDYDKVRKASKQLLGFYRDLSGSFRGLDARIPREMDQKGRDALLMLAKVNLRLAALFRRQNQPEIAVPLLIEVIRLVTPTKPEGQMAYQRLLELGFVETPYAGAR